MKKKGHKLNLKKYFIIGFYYSVLRRDWHISMFWKDILLRIVAVIVVSLDRFVKDASTISASALTFYATLSFIPVIALVLAIARGFGAAKALEDWLKGHTYTNPEVMEWVMGVANKALENSQSGIIAGFGIVLLLWSVVRMLSSTELAMNRIWGVEKGRSLTKKFTDYLSILFIAPILVVLISSGRLYTTPSPRDS